MDFQIPYGNDSIRIHLPGNARILTLPQVQKRYEKETVRTALRKQFGNLKFREFVDGAQKLLVIVNDAHRATPTEKVLDFTYDKFLAAGNPDFIVATGTHPPPGEEELESIFGAYLDRLRSRIAVHDSRNNESHFDIGEALDGSPVRLDRVLLEYDSILVIGSVELHYFSGFTGGRKAFLPGLASYDTVERNHHNAMRPGSGIMELEGNPVHEGMDHALGLVQGMGKRIFSIQSVLDPDGDIYAAAAGDTGESLMHCARIARRVYTAETCGKADVVILGVEPPLDRNLYHSHKAIENARQIYADGAAIILVAGCHEGLGPDNFVKLMESSDDPAEILETIEKGYRLGYHKTARLLDLMGRTEIMAYTTLPDSEIERVKFIPVSDLQAAIDKAIEKRGGPGKAKVMVVPDGGNTCPVCESGDE